jgi:RNA-directed DNA polymerase
MHRPIAGQGRWLGLVFRGFSQYHAVTTNGRAVNSFRGELARSWYRSLRRRSEKRRINWKKLDRLVKHWIPALPPESVILGLTNALTPNTQGKSPVR